MLLYTAENSLFFIMFVSFLSTLAGVSTAIIELEKNDKLDKHLFSLAIIFKGAFIGATAPVVMFLVLLAIEPMAIDTLKLHFDISTSTLRFIYLGLSLIFSRVLVLALYVQIEKKGRDL